MESEQVERDPGTGDVHTAGEGTIDFAPGVAARVVELRATVPNWPFGLTGKPRPTGLAQFLALTDSRYRTD